MTSIAVAQDLQTKAEGIRRATLSLIADANAGHPGSSLSTVEVLTTLYYHVLRIRRGDPLWPDRDRMVLSKGHAAPALYAVLRDLDMYPAIPGEQLRAFGSRLQGHPDRRFTPGVDVSTGSLGQGFSIGVGLALGAQKLRSTWRVFVLLGDGECQEGQVWEAAHSAAQLGLGRLWAIVDCNGLQHDGTVEEIVNLEPMPAKWRACGWNCVELDGHDCGALVEAFNAPDTGRPTVVIARTVKGKGVPFMEGRLEWHSVVDSALLSPWRTS